MTVLDEQAIEIDGVGFAGVKGFMGGYGRGELAPFGEPIAKAFVAGSDGRGAQAREPASNACGPSAASPCSIIRRPSTRSKASPRPSTNISARSACAMPIDRFDHVKAVFHGHAHHGTYEGATPRGTPVYNVAQFVLKPLFGKPYVVVEI